MARMQVRERGLPMAVRQVSPGFAWVIGCGRVRRTSAGAHPISGSREFDWTVAR
jgi:hypothetical protein